MAVSEESSSSSSRPNTSNLPSSSKNNSDAFYLAKTVLRGSVILQAVCGHFRSPSSYEVVFGKETSIELVIVDEDGIVQSISEQPVFGTIKDLAVLPWSGNFQVKNPKASSWKDAGSGCFVAASAYEDQLAIFSLSMSESGDIIDKKVLCPPEKDGRLKSLKGSTNICGTIWSMYFISDYNNQQSKERKPVLAILLNRWGSFYRNEFLLLEWNIEEQDVQVYL